MTLAAKLATIATVFVLACAIAGAHGASANMGGGCHASVVSSSGAVDLTTADELHLRRADVLTVRGDAPANQTHVQVTFYVFGLGIKSPLIGGLNERSDSQSGIAVSTYSRVARVVDVAATTDSCSGTLLVAVDDQSPLLTAVGGAGAILGALGLLGLLRAAFGQGRAGSRVGGGISGFVAGIGTGLLLQQMLWIDPRNAAGLALPAGGLVLGAVLAGSLRRKRVEAPTAGTPAVPVPTEVAVTP